MEDLELAVAQPNLAQ